MVHKYAGIAKYENLLEVSDIAGFIIRRPNKLNIGTIAYGDYNKVPNIDTSDLLYSFIFRLDNDNSDFTNIYPILYSALNSMEARITTEEYVWMTSVVVTISVMFISIDEDKEGACNICIPLVKKMHISKKRIENVVRLLKELAKENG